MNKTKTKKRKVLDAMTFMQMIARMNLDGELDAAGNEFESTNDDEHDALVNVIDTARRITGIRPPVKYEPLRDINGEFCVYMTDEYGVQNCVSRSFRNITACDKAADKFAEREAKARRKAGDKGARANHFRGRGNS